MFRVIIEMVPSAACMLAYILKYVNSREISRKAAGDELTGRYP